MNKVYVEEIIKKHQDEYHQLIPGLKQNDLKILDFTEASPYLNKIDLVDTEAFHKLLFQEVLQDKIGIGGFFEDRIIYRRSSHYDGEEARSIHLGLDIWASSGTKLFSPLAGSIHSMQDNQGFGNYGPTLILEHQLEDVNFYVLYGHLSRETLHYRHIGEHIAAGQLLGEIGHFPENGDWPPHLHWQVMIDMLDHVGDFPGVAALSDQKFYLQLCINPYYLLKLSE